ncbi:MAG: FixH family protein [Alphaproteobacteria bacterium]|jgi:nitrogen fixation protein FixH|nr:FixH family protein [Alphaproteobacteria bacterium]
MSGQGLTGRHVAWVLAGFFGLIVAANAVLVVTSLDSWPGLGAKNAYVAGLAYNRQLEAAEAQRARGWSVNLSLEESEQRRVRLSATYRDASGEALPGLVVQASFKRPVHEGLDFAMALEPVGDGVYAVELTAPAAGNWDLRLEASDAGEIPSVRETRLWLP